MRHFPPYVAIKASRVFHCILTFLASLALEKLAKKGKLCLIAVKKGRKSRLVNVSFLKKL